VDFHSFDAEYVQRLSEGDPKTEQHFTTYFGELLLLKLRARLRSPELVDEIRQETFLRVLTALRRKRTLEHPERLGAFVNSVCNNILFEHYRNMARPQSLESINEPVSPAISPETLLVSAEQKEQVRYVLRELPERDQRLLRQVFLRERDKDEICAEFQVSREYLRVLVHRSVERARKLLKQQESCKREHDTKLPGGHDNERN
jgi:RNA polymerase sigma-70 factor, ECF subfamily